MIASAAVSRTKSAGTAGPEGVRPLLAFATQGSGGNDEARLCSLLSGFPTEFARVERGSRVRTFRLLLRKLRERRHALSVMEGTGLPGGAALLLGRLLYGTRYVVSSGDAVGPFFAARNPALGVMFGLYERLLCRCSSGFIGWTPYLAGRALTFGAPRAMTAANWAPFHLTPEKRTEARRRVRTLLGIPEYGLVCGIAGSLKWNSRAGFCYGFELVEALRCAAGRNLYAVVLGDGDGRPYLRSRAGPLLGRRFLLPGSVAREELPDYLAAFDLASLPQSVDGVGSFRYTTKLSEYLAAGVPVVTGRIPLAYDLDGGWLWRLPGDRPWGAEYIHALAELLDNLTQAECRTRADRIPAAPPEFDMRRQIERTTAFLEDLLEGPRP